MLLHSASAHNKPLLCISLSLGDWRSVGPIVSGAPTTRCCSALEVRHGKQPPPPHPAFSPLPHCLMHHTHTRTHHKHTHARTHTHTPQTHTHTQRANSLAPHNRLTCRFSSTRESGNDHVTYYELDALYGHDTFLIDVNTVGAAVKGHLEHCCL